MLGVAKTVHWFLKHSLNMLHFSLMSVIKVPSCRIGGIMVVIFFFKIFFIADQYFFLAVMGFDRSDPRDFMYFSFSLSTKVFYLSFMSSMSVLSGAGHPFLRNFLNFLLYLL